MAEVKKIALTLENCEVWEFDRKDIGDFHCIGISRVVSRIASNAMRDYTECDELFIELFSSANTPKETQFYDEPKTPFERLAEYSDITAVEITYDNGTSEYIYVPFDGDFNVPGTTQTCYLSKCGNLYIRISEKGDVKELLDLDEVDDAEYMNYKREMYTL